MKKLLAVGVIVLFLGLAFTPSIYALNMNPKCVEVNCWINYGDRIKENNIILSKQESLAIQNIFDTIKTKLDDAKTQEATTKILNEAISELNEHKVFPNDVSVQELQQLVSSFPLNQKALKILDKIGRRPYLLNKNFLCYIVGNTTRTHFHSFFLYYLDGCPYEFIVSFFERFHLVSAFFGGIITFGEVWGAYHISNWPAQGWVYTNGALGVKNWTGSFFGRVFPYGMYQSLLPYGAEWVTVTGFRGFKVSVGNGYNYYLGFASRVGIRPLN